MFGKGNQMPMQQFGQMQNGYATRDKPPTRCTMNRALKNWMCSDQRLDREDSDGERIQPREGCEIAAFIVDDEKRGLGKLCREKEAVGIFFAVGGNIDDNLVFGMALESTINFNVLTAVKDAYIQALRSVNEHFRIRPFSIDQILASKVHSRKEKTKMKLQRKLEQMTSSGRQFNTHSFQSSSNSYDPPAHRVPKQAPMPSDSEAVPGLVTETDTDGGMETDTPLDARGGNSRRRGFDDSIDKSAVGLKFPNAQQTHGTIVDVIKDADGLKFKFWLDGSDEGHTEDLTLDDLQACLVGHYPIGVINTKLQPYLNVSISTPQRRKTRVPNHWIRPDLDAPPPGNF